MAAPMCKHFTKFNKLFLTVCVQRVVQPVNHMPGIGLTQARHRSQKSKSTKKAVTGKKKSANVYLPPSFPYTDPSNVKKQKSWITRIPSDDVYLIDKYAKQAFPLDDALFMCKELADPYNLNSAKVAYANMMFNMHTKQEKKYHKAVNMCILPPAPFLPAEKIRLAVFTKSEENQQKARDMGADLVGAVNLLEKIENEEIDLSAIDSVIATVDMQEHLYKYRRVFKNKIPAIGKGDLGERVEEMIKLYQKCIRIKMEIVKEGICKSQIAFAQLNMPVQDMIKNFQAVVNSISKTKSNAPKGLKADVPFMYELTVNVESSPEVFYVNPEPYDFIVAKKAKKAE